MDPGERKGWLEVVGADDLDTHLSNIGQAQANAEIKKEMFRHYPLQQGSRLLIAGCGTAHFCEYISPLEFGNDLEITLADFNAKYLEKCKTRIAKFPEAKYQIVEDDIEETKLIGPYNGILIVLVLQHVEWQKAIKSMVSLDPSNFYIIIQEQNTPQHAVTKGRDDLAPVWIQYAEVANPKLVPRKELITFLKEKGYDLSKAYEREVPDNKVMTGLVFQKA